MCQKAAGDAGMAEIDQIGAPRVNPGLGRKALAPSRRANQPCGEEARQPAGITPKDRADFRLYSGCEGGVPPELSRRKPSATGKTRRCWSA